MSYGKLNAEDIVLSSEVISVPVWSNGSDTLSSIASGSSQSSGSKEFYTDIYVSGHTGSTDPVQFSIAYAQSGSADSDDPKNTVFCQFRSLVLGDETANFEFGNTFWVIAIERARFKESIIPGSLILKLGGTVAANEVKEHSTDPVILKDCGRVSKLYKGSSSTCCGYLLLDVGVILVTDTITTPAGFITAINSFTIKSQETVTSNYVFIRAKNGEFNYSMNPTFVNEKGEINDNLAANSPETFITSVGLYNNNNELLAVAKLSRPLIKNFTKEALIRVKLDY